MLAISGRVLPVTNENVALEATFENGTRVLGESKISAFKKEQDCRIERRPPCCPSTQRLCRRPVRAIGEAELILLGPGSLYTSVIPNLLVEGVVEAICRSEALKIYVCNIMTQEGETEGYTAADHVDALLSHGAPGLVDLCLANSAPVRPGLVEKYREEDAAPILVDRERIRAMGLELEEYPVASEGATMPATTRTGWRRRCWTCTAGGRCASSGANSGTSLRSETMSFAERPRGSCAGRR